MSNGDARISNEDASSPNGHAPRSLGRARISADAQLLSARNRRPIRKSTTHRTFFSPKAPRRGGYRAEGHDAGMGPAGGPSIEQGESSWSPSIQRPPTI